MDDERNHTGVKEIVTIERVACVYVCVCVRRDTCLEREREREIDSELLRICCIVCVCV